MVQWRGSWGSQWRHFPLLKQPSLAQLQDQAKGDVSHGSTPAKLLMGFPTETAKGDVSHGSTPAKLSWVSRQKQPKACAAPRFFVGTGQVQRRIISWEVARGVWDNLTREEL
jgi:hypothetical protein